MKKTFLSILFLVILLLVPTLVFAADTDVAKVGEETFATFEDALNKASETGKDVEMLSNATLTSTYNVIKDLTINLNGFTISGGSPTFEVKGAKFNVNGNGTLKETAPDYAPILIRGSENSSDENYSVVNVGTGVVLEGWAGIMIKSADNNKNYSYGVVLNCEGATINSVKDQANNVGHGIYLNGNVKNQENCPIIKLKDTTITSKGAGIYFAGFGKWNITGGSITAPEMGLGIKSGIITLNDVMVNANGPYAIPTGNGNGINSTGAAIQIEEYKNYAGKIDLTINGGSYTSKNNSALLEYTTSVDGVTFLEEIKINGGTFKSVEGKNALTFSKSFEETIKGGFISGGTFSTDVDASYLAQNVTSEKDASGNYVVGTRYNVVVKDSTNGTVKASSERAMKGESVTLTVTPNKGYRLSKLTVNGENVVDNKFVMPAKNATVVAEFEIIPTDVEYVAPDNKTENNNVGAVETEDIKEILESSLKANSELNNIVEEAKKEGKDVKVTVNIEKIDAKDIKEEDKEKLLAVVLEDGTVCEYFDISILVSIDNEVAGALTELTDKMKFSIKLSEDLIVEGRKFYILKLHDGKVEKIEAVLNGTNLEFETDEFSTYALAYEDIKEEIKDTNEEQIIENETEENEGKDETPKTGIICISTFIWLAMATIAVVALKKNKKVSKHSK